MPPVEFEPTISGSERPQIDILDRAATADQQTNNIQRCKNSRRLQTDLPSSIHLKYIQRYLFSVPRQLPDVHKEH